MAQDRGKDIHFVPEYARGFEKHEGGKVEVFRHTSAAGEVSHLFIRRPILVNRYEAYSDILTPYGYGGPVIETCEPGRETELAEEYRVAFDRYCREEKIVCNFTRFNPIFRNNEIFAGSYDEVSAIRDIVIVDLTKDVYHEEFDKTARKNLKKYDGEISIEYDPDCARLQDFVDIYYDTMDKNNAKDFYYFDREYFERLVRENEGHVSLYHAYVGDEMIASKLLLTEGEIVYSQFGGTKKDSYGYNANPYLLSRYLLELEKDGKYKYVVLGGGVTNDKDDGVFRFKKHYSKSLHKFHIGKRIYDAEIYNRICEETGVKGRAENSDFFPAYRER